MSFQAYDLKTAARERVGQVVCGKWTLDRLIDIGGMGAVYAATHRNGKKVALKMLHASLSSETELKSRFLREGYIANRINHPGALSILDDDTAEDGSAFLVMELLVGESLEDRLGKSGNWLPPEAVFPIADQALDVLAAAHDAGVVHRDIKPGNVFLTSTGEVKLLDFGLARAKELSFPGSTTRTGMVMGTASYMPPEQARARWNLVDARSDIWALGATIFRTLTGRFVHLGATTNDRLVSAMSQPARSLGSVLPELPRSLIELIDKSLAFQKNERWQDARAMQAAVRDSWREFSARSAKAPAAPANQSWGEPTEYGPDAEESSDAVPVSVVFETPESHPESIMVEISDGTGGRQTFELQTASGSSVDELLELPPASVLPGRRGGA
jgi:eukaryotic-like serine/threonine-protein kinase